ncbi:hypothetical protein M8998_08260 [Sphingobacterium sp. lm-10]|uniref:hypothetical protein n=1 Tax=Sphingobacterium sp. lm-10 TaxID=2944904 RepID=UPI002021093E|nr:hypothetical protein [Sphingobacterium sp. lm-10]MCL7987929.1 hypothetical protein [Sphingobacterium sp. lm-10]
MKKINVNTLNLHSVGLLSRNEMKNISGGGFYRCTCAGTPATAETFIINITGEPSDDQLRDICNYAHDRGDKCEGEFVL